MRPIRWLYALVAAAVLMVTLGAVPAYASTSGGPSGPRAFDLVLNSWPVLLAGFTGFVSSELTAFITHHKAPQWVKSLTNLVFTSLGGAIITVQTVPGHTWKDYTGIILAGWLVSLGTHFAGLTALVGSLSSDIGIGATASPLVLPSGTTLTASGAASSDAAPPQAVDLGPGTY